MENKEGKIMADAKQQQGQETQIERRRERGGLARRGEFFPMISPREFFSMGPFELMRRMNEEMNRVFGEFLREERVAWTPAIEVRERDNNLIVTADLPGMTKDDVKIEITDDSLIIRGERKRKEEERREGFYRSEVAYGEFYRAIPLPEGADLDKAKAQFNNGVLELTIPIPEAKRKTREIPIESEQKTRTSGGGA
jgi:HSP20 family protein